MLVGLLRRLLELPFIAGDAVLQSRWSPIAGEILPALPNLHADRKDA